MRPYEQLRSRTGTETHSESYTVSTSTWYKPWTWGDTETRYRTFSVNYEYLSASDAVEQLSRYARDCSHDLENHFNQLVSPSQLKLNLRRTLLDALQTHGTDFDPAQFRNTLEQAINRLLPGMPRRDVIRASLEGRGALILTRSLEEACDISNRIAPEHLEVSSTDPHRWEPLLRHAGAIFLGAYTSESLGDYCAGPNHVLPTSGTARFSSPLGVYDFQKRSSLIEVSEAGAQVLGPIAAELAYGEGLQAHAQAAEFRLKGKQR